MKKRNKKNNRRGFSFAEVMVSVFLLSTGLLAAVSLVSSDLARIINNRNQTIAGLLAEEGVELVVYVRDLNIKKGEDSFSAGNSGDKLPASSEEYCIFDPLYLLMPEGKIFCDQDFAEMRLLYSDNWIKGYFYPGGEESKFSRKISIEYFDANNSPSIAVDASSMKVTSMVIWGGTSFPEVSGCNTSTQCTYAETTLTNWKDE